MCNLHGIDWDSALSYETSRTVKLRDWRLGSGMLALQFSIFSYVVINAVFVQQGYMLEGKLFGTFTTQLQEPPQQWYYPFNSLATPICIPPPGVNATVTDPRFRFPSPGYYQYIGDGNLEGNPIARQQPCVYLDERYAVPDTLKSEIFVPTYVQMYQQALPPPIAAECGAMAFANCTRDWTVTNSSTVFVPIIDLMLITVAHSFGSSIGIDGDGLQMQGVLLGPGGAPLDPCSVYPADIFTAGCPPQVQRAFSKGSFTTIPIRALMQAAGIFSLDEAPSTFGQPPPAVNNITRRIAGVTLQLEISYSNYYAAAPRLGRYAGTSSMDPGVVTYAFKVTEVPTIGVQQFETVTADGSLMTNRTVYQRQGIRILVTQGGQIGRFDFQTLLLNLTTAISLLSLASFLMDQLALRACPMRAVYRQYKERVSISLSELKQSEDTNLIHRFKEDPNIVDPILPLLQDAIVAKRQREHDRAIAMGRPMRNKIPRSMSWARAMGLPLVDTITPTAAPHTPHYALAPSASTLGTAVSAAPSQSPMASASADGPLLAAQSPHDGASPTPNTPHHHGPIVISGGVPVVVRSNPLASPHA